MNNDSRTFGEVYFEKLDSSEYLKNIYENILVNYAAKVFGFDKYLLREVSISEALHLSDILSKSNHPIYSDAHKMWAQEIITLLNYTYPENNEVKYIAGSVLENVGNYRGQNIIKSEFNGTDVLDRLCIEYKKKFYAIPTEPENKFMVAQKTVFDHLGDKCFSYSGPTSMGKSYLMRMFLKLRILEGYNENFAFIVPSKALINEVRQKIIDDLKESLHDHNYHIVTAVGDAALKSEDKNRNYIFIMTPERLLYLLLNEPQIDLDYLFIDEAHKMSMDNSSRALADKRSPFYYQFTQMLSEREHKPHIIFASPNIPNPEIYLNLVPDTQETFENKTSRGSLASTFSPVTQEKFIVNLENGEVSVYNDHTKESIPLSFIAQEFADLTDVLLRFEHSKEGKENHFIVYLPSTGKAVTAARDFAANRMPKVGERELEELAKDIRSEVHDQYYLADLVEKGVAYHIGYLPSSIRQRIERLFINGKITALFCTSTLIEGVNLPADNLFVAGYKNGPREMRPVDFRNLIGRVGRLDYSLYGNVFFVALSSNHSDKYIQLLEQKIENQKLSIEKGLTKTQKKKIIESLVAGNIELEKYPADQTADNYDMMRKFAIILMNDILKNRNSFVYREFAPFLKTGDTEKIKQNFAGEKFIQDDDITVSVDQTESLYEAIAYNGLEFPKIINGRFDKDELTTFLERLCRIFKWEKYESSTLGHVSKNSDSLSKSHGMLRRYQVILSRWVRGEGLQSIMYYAIKYKADNPINAMYTEGRYYNYNGSKEHNNIIISETLDDIEQIILFKLSNYFLKFSKAYKEIKGEEPKDDWYEFVEYGSLNKETINIEKNGFSRESAIYILSHPEYIAERTPELKLHTSIFECPSRGVREDTELIRYNVPEIFVD